MLRTMASGTIMRFNRRLKETLNYWLPLFRRLSFVVFLAASLLYLNGCAGSGYLSSRACDAGDIVTLTLGFGGGAKARLGSMRVGLLYQSDTVGYRNGSRLHNLSGEAAWNRMDIALLVIGFESFDSGSNLRGKRFAALSGFPGTAPGLKKKSDQWRWIPPPPILTTLDPEFSSQRAALFHPYYSQCEVCFGLLGTIRLGVNPGELVDFILGWFGVDFFDDDYSYHYAGNPKEDESKPIPTAGPSAAAETGPSPTPAPTEPAGGRGP